MKFPFLFFFILLYGSIISQSNDLQWEYNFRNYSVRSGLPSSETYDVKQDNDGNIWIATDRGVVRYDGRNFVTFTKKDGLIDEVVFQIYKDPFGRMWFIGYKHELCYYDKGIITSYPFNEKIRQFAGAFEYPVKSILILEDESLVFSLPGPGGSVLIDKKGNTKKIPQNKNTIEVLSFGKHRIYSCKLKDKVEAALFYQADSSSKKIFIDSVRHNTTLLQYTENQHHAVLLAGDQLYELNSQKKLVGRGTKIIYVRLIDQMLAVASLGKGISFYNIEKEELQLVRSELQQHSVTNVLKDHQGGYWFSTLDAGVFYLKSFEVQGIKKGLLSNNIKQVYGFKDKIFVSFSGTEGYQILSGEKAESKLPNARNIIFSTAGSNLIISNTSYSGTDKIEKTQFHNWFRDIYGTEKHALLASDIVVKSDENGITDTIYHANENDLKYFQAVMEDELGTIWLGTKHGLFTLSSHQQLRRFQPHKFIYHVTDLLYHPHWGKLVATRDAGLFNLSGQSFRKIEGLLSNDITYLFCDTKNRLWICTGKGLNILTRLENGTVKTNAITTSHGLYSDEITSVFVDNEVVWVGTKEGISKINLNAFQPGDESYKIRLNAFLVDNTPVDTRKKIAIPHYKNSITIDFGATDFITKGQYKYHLNPEDEWVYTQDPKITLLNLQDGKYQLEAAFLDEENRWSAVQQIVRFEILPPFWKTWYFTVLIVLFTGLLFALYLRYKKRQSDTRERLLVLEQNALFAQMNPHFIFNALNSITSFLLYDEHRKAEYYLGKFSKLLRETLHASRETTVTIQTEIGMLEKYLELERMRFPDQFIWSITCEIPEQFLKARIPGMLIQPYVENAIKHGFEGTTQYPEVGIRLTLIDGSQLKCEIEDNGIGRLASLERKKKKNMIKEEYVSYGEKITRERLETYNRNQKSKKHNYGVSIVDLDENGVSKGTKVEIYIPLLNDDKNRNM